MVERDNLKRICFRIILKSSFFISFKIFFRKFFEEKTGCLPTVEFMRDSEDKNFLFLALRFDSKSIAKNVIEK